MMRERQIPPIEFDLTAVANAARGRITPNQLSPSRGTLDARLYDTSELHDTAPDLTSDFRHSCQIEGKFLVAQSEGP